MGGRLFLSSDYFFQRKHGRRGTKSKSKKEEEIKQERWRSATRETPSACSGGNEAFPERELCHLQGRAMWITTQKRRIEEACTRKAQHVQGGPWRCPSVAKVSQIREPPTRGVGRRECGQLAMRWGGQGDGGFDRYGGSVGKVVGSRGGAVFMVACPTVESHQEHIYQPSSRADGLLQVPKLFCLGLC